MTYHSISRTKERANVGEKSAIKMISHAKERGKEATKLPSRERKYLESKESVGKHAIYYAGYCFIFNSSDTCITMFSVPKWFGKKASFAGKESIRNIKKYYKCYPSIYDELEYIG